MAGIEDYDCEGTLTIGGVSMNRPAWAVLGDELGTNGLLQFVVLGERRGEDRVLPGAAGVIPYRRRLTSTRYDLRILVAGDVDENGTPTANALQGLIANLLYLYNNVVADPGGTDGTRAATLDLPGQSQMSADVHVIGLEPQQYKVGDSAAVFSGTLQLSIPAGRFS